MRLTEIDTENRLIFRFKYKDKAYSMPVNIISKSTQCIIIPAILNRNQVLDPNSITNADLIFTVKDGIYNFQDLKIEASTIMDKNVYLLFSDTDCTKINRREAYRLFVGEILKINVISKDGSTKVYDGILKDMSILGMGIILKNDIEIGTMINVQYSYGGICVQLVGEVIRKSKMDRFRAYTYGCKFFEPNNSVFRIIVMKQLTVKKDKTDAN